jgi:hypothetical protein
VGTIKVAGPDARSQSVAGAVGVTDDFFFALKGDERRDRTKNFFLIRRGRGIKTFNQGGLDEPAFRATTGDFRAAAPGQDASTGVAGGFDGLHDFTEMSFRNQRALLGIRFERISYTQAFHVAV